jgi:hypothetical protein
MQRRPLLGNRFVTRNNGVIGKWSYLCGLCDGYMTHQLLGEVFSMWSVPRLHKESTVCCEFISRKPVSSAQELQVIGVSRQGQELLDRKAEDATPLEATTKQCGKDREGGH